MKKGNVFVDASKVFFLTLAVLMPADAAYLKGDDLRKSFNDASYGATPFENRDLISFRNLSGNHSVVISGSSISKTGAVPAYAFFSQGNVDIGNMQIDWRADDTFTRTFSAMEASAAGQILASGDLQQLRDKKSWTPEDRTKWDSSVANIIAGVVHETPGLDRYRTDGDGQLPHLRRVNDLGLDIQNKTYAHAFDCKAMSVLKIVLQERMSARFLTRDQSSRYFLVLGEIDLDTPGYTPAGHAYIVSEKDKKVTGIIEATADSNVYFEPAAAYTFAGFVGGDKIVTTEGRIYGFEFTQQEADRLRSAAIKPDTAFRPGYGPDTSSPVSPAA